MEAMFRILRPVASLAALPPPTGWAACCECFGFRHFDLFRQINLWEVKYFGKLLPNHASMDARCDCDRHRHHAAVLAFEFHGV